MTDVTLELLGRQAQVFPGVITGTNARVRSISGVGATGQIWAFPTGNEGVYTTRVLPLTYRENWQPPIPTNPTVKGSTLTNLEIDANFRVLQDAIIQWTDTLEWAQTIINTRFLQIVDLFADPGRAQSSYIETVDGQGNIVDKGYIFNGYVLQPEYQYNVMFRMYNNSPATFYIPHSDFFNFRIGSSVLVSWNGGTDGTVTIAGQAGVTLYSPDTLQIARRYGKVTLIKVGQNDWEIEGNLKVNY